MKENRWNLIASCQYSTQTTKEKEIHEQRDSQRHRQVGPVTPKRNGVNNGITYSSDEPRHTATYHLNHHSTINGQLTRH